MFDKNINKSYSCMLGLVKPIYSRVGYRQQKPYVRTTVYRNSIKLTVIVNLSAAMGIHSIDMATSHGV